jgi:Mycothiol maleylpyruvate isomerase N-terminal domain
MTAQNTTGRGIVDLDAQAVEATVSLVKRARLADFGRPTPCAGWSLADLIGHMTAQHYGWIAATLGRSPSWPR